ncbi:MAG: DUF1003 domain-containing protein [Candidatus Woykebacteria bacterium]
MANKDFSEHSQERSPFQERLQSSRRIIKSFQAKADAKRSFAEKVADYMTTTFGSIRFLTVNVIWFVTWILINTNLIPGVKPFDPFPFGLLTTVVSLEAIILAIFVLISQNRESKINDLREEVGLQLDIITEQEITKLLEMVAKLMNKDGIDTESDELLKEMLSPTDTNRLEKSLEKQVNKESFPMPKLEI